jgi:hypothetical protein
MHSVGKVALMRGWRDHRRVGNYTMDEVYVKNHVVINATLVRKCVENLLVYGCTSGN